MTALRRLMSSGVNDSSAGRLPGLTRPGELPEDLLHQQQVDVVAAQMRVAVGGEHLEDAVFDAEDRDVERAAAQVVHRDDAGVPLVEPVGERRGRRLVDDPQHVEAGDASGVARGGPLRVVEVRRHGDDRAIDVRIDLALGGEELFRPALQLAEDEGGNLRRRELAVSESDPDDARRVAADGEGEQTRFVAYVGQTLAHEPLDRIHRAVRVGHQPALGFATDVHGAVGGHRDDRGDQPIARRSRITSGTPSFT